jgi:hypothetical protein
MQSCSNECLLCACVCGEDQTKEQSAETLFTCEQGFLTPRRKQGCNDDTQTMFFHKVRDNVLMSCLWQRPARDNILMSCLWQRPAHLLQREKEREREREERAGRKLGWKLRWATAGIWNVLLGLWKQGFPRTSCCWWGWWLDCQLAKGPHLPPDTRTVLGSECITTSYVS